ncbi:hypothetical protein J2847_003354 [Azospirillum agricola]|uniref:hypothetical protein n=1 Tax=Azospirillum agricola TaxID=1720247 RepID=UPI001F3E0FC4|nr:hypothetical protein [Azospirillum agricola]MBP2230051.1 hypothetical protein [Azospirillum agricola]
MNVSDLSAAGPAIRSGTAAPSARTAATAARGAETATSRSDSVELSPLAVELKDDALTVFSGLSSEDRSTLGGLVSSGAISARDLGLALTSRLKEARAGAFWEGARQAVGSSQGNPLDISMEEMAAFDQRRAAMRSGGDPLEAMRDMAAEFSRTGDSASRGSVGTGGTPFVMKAGDERYVQNDDERQAGKRLSSLGFKSESFDSAVRLLANADVSRFVKADKDDSAAWKPGQEQ